jgi:thiol-disulfide isomerase/thioredoxin
MKNAKIIIAAALATIIYTFMIFCGQRAMGENPATVADSTATVPVWSLKDLNDKTIKSADLKGKVVILDFWATWCGPCHEEIPGFIALQKQYGDQGLAVIGASVDEGGLAVVKKFAANLGMNYPIGVADDNLQRAVGGVDVLPTTLIIDPQGHIVKEHIGFTDKAEFEAEIKALLPKGK